MEFTKNNTFWIHEPTLYHFEEGKLSIITEPETDFWQRTYYGFRNDNAPALLIKTDEPYFSFTIKTEFDSTHRFDQCGIMVYQDSDNWLKASIEYENEYFQRLGSVVTNYGFSDWATTDIPADQKSMFYRLSRRKSDYLVENSYDGIHFKQMRIAHLFQGEGHVNVGVYACSPEKSSFQAVFSEAIFSECLWEPHQ